MIPFRLLCKRLLLAIAVVLAGPLILASWLEALFFGLQVEWIYNSCKELLAIIPTTIGQYLRLGFYWAVCTRVSPDVAMLLGSMIAHRGTTIGRGSCLGAYSIVGHADLGENVLLGARVSILSGKYQHGSPKERANGEATTNKYTRTTIGDNCWIGEGAIIMANVGANCTVSAGAVVMRDVADKTTVMGNPARKVSLN